MASGHCSVAVLQGRALGTRYPCTIERYEPYPVQVYSVHLCIFLSNVGPKQGGKNPRHCSGAFSHIRQFAAFCLVSQNAMPSSVTEIICHLGKRGEATIPKHGIFTEKTYPDARYFTEN